MLLKGKTAVISGAASAARHRPRHGAACSPRTARASPSSISTRPRPTAAAAELGAGPSRPRLRRHRPDRLPGGRRGGDRGVRAGRRAGQQRRRHPAGEDHGHRRGELGRASSTSTCAGVLYLSQAVIPHMRGAQVRLDRLHVVGLGPARRRHLRRPALLAPPRPACSASPRRWRASSARTASASTASRPA